MKIVFATNNKNKLSEIRDILGSDFEIVSLQDIGRHTGDRLYTRRERHAESPLYIRQL